MARKRDPRRDEAKKIWLDSNGKKVLKDLAKELNVSDSQIRKWKSIDKWSAELKGNVTNAKGNVTNRGGAPFGNQNAVGNKGIGSRHLLVIRTLLKLANTKQYLPICYLMKKRISILI